jgi:hypothetical protein
MTTDRMQKKPVTMRGMLTTTALATSLLLANAAFAADAVSTTHAQTRVSAADAGDATPGPRIDRTRPGRRQPAFGLRRLTPPPAPSRPR